MPKKKQKIVPAKSQQTTSMQPLPLPFPKYIILQIIDLLTIQDTLKFREVSKYFHQLINDHYIERFNQLFWGETFAEFKLTNLRDFKFKNQPLPAKKQKKTKKPKHEVARETFDQSLAKTWNSANCVDFFFNRVALSKTTLLAKYSKETVDYYWPLMLFALTGSTAEFKEFSNTKRSERNASVALGLDIFLLNHSTNPTISQIILELIKNNSYSGMLNPAHSSEAVAYAIFQRALRLPLNINPQLKLLTMEMAKLHPNNQMKIFNEIVKQGRCLEKKSELFPYLLKNKNSLSKNDLEIFNFIKTGDKTFFNNYVEQHPDKKDVKNFDLRLELLKQLVQQIQLKAFFTLAEDYLTNFSDLIPQLQPVAADEFLYLVFETEDADIFQKFVAENSVIWKVLKKREENNIGDFYVFLSALTHRCLEYIEYFIQYFPVPLTEATLYRAGLIAYEKGRLEHFTNLVLKHCNQLSHIPLIIAAQKNAIEIVLKITDENVINAYFKTKTALHHAAELGHQQIITILLNNKANLHARATIRSFLCPTWYVALLKNHLTLGQQLLESSVKENPYLAIFKAIIADDLTAVEKAITSQPFSQINHCTLDGIHVLDLASLLRREKIISYFLEIANFSADSQNIIIAVKNNHLSLLQSLIEKGGDVNVKIDNKSLLTFALEQCYLDIAEYLLTKGAKVCRMDFFSPIPTTRKSLILQLFDADPAGHYGLGADNTHLLLQTYINDIDICLELLARKSIECGKLDFKKKDVLSNLFFKIAKGDKVVTSTSKGVRGISATLLLENKSYKTPRGMSLLAYALKCSHNSVVNYFATAQDIDVVGNAFACSPILLAAQKNTWDFVDQLMGRFIAQQDATNQAFYNAIVKQIYQLSENPRLLENSFASRVKKKIEPVWKKIMIGEQPNKLGCSNELKSAIESDDSKKVEDPNPDLSLDAENSKKSPSSEGNPYSYFNSLKHPLSDATPDKTPKKSKYDEEDNPMPDSFSPKSQ